MYKRYEKLLNGLTKALFEEYKVTNRDYFHLEDNIGLIKVPDNTDCMKLNTLVNNLYQTFEIVKPKLNISSGYWEDLVTIHCRNPKTCLVITIEFKVGIIYKKEDIYIDSNYLTIEQRHHLQELTDTSFFHHSKLAYNTKYNKWATFDRFSGKSKILIDYKEFLELFER